MEFFRFEKTISERNTATNQRTYNVVYPTNKSDAIEKATNDASYSNLFHDPFPANASEIANGVYLSHTNSHEGRTQHEGWVVSNNIDDAYKMILNK